MDVVLKSDGDTRSTVDTTDEDRRLGPWIFGMCTETNNARLNLVSDRSVRTLLLIIQVNDRSEI